MFLYVKGGGLLFDMGFYYVLVFVYVFGLVVLVVVFGL